VGADATQLKGVVGGEQAYSAAATMSRSSLPQQSQSVSSGSNN
jgi:hypothetical protein